MTGDRWKQLSSALAVGAETGEGRSELCRACRDLFEGAGAGVTLVTGRHRSLLGVSDATTATVEELQFTLGVGPSIDASTCDRAVLEPDLAAEAASARWPAFAPAAVDAGFRAAFAFPLRVGAARVGALTIYRAQAGSMSPGSRSEAMVAATLVTQAVLAAQTGGGGSAPEVDLGQVGSPWPEVHQASGMVSVQLGIDVVEALLRLRSYAYAAGRPVGEVAADVVARRLRLDD